MEGEVGWLKEMDVGSVNGGEGLNSVANGNYYVEAWIS